MLDTSAVLFSWPLSLGCCNVELEGVAGEREGDAPVWSLMLVGSVWSDCILTCGPSFKSTSGSRSLMICSNQFILALAAFPKLPSHVSTATQRAQELSFTQRSRGSLSRDENVGILTVDIETDLVGLCAVGARRDASIALPISGVSGPEPEVREGGIISPALILRVRHRWHARRTFLDALILPSINNVTVAFARGVVVCGINGIQRRHVRGNAWQHEGWVWG